MAIADTAELIIALNLKGNAERALGGINRQIDNLSRNATVRGGLSQIGAGIGLGFQRGAAIAAIGAAGIATQVAAGVRSLRELEDVQAQTRAGIESTGGAAGQTADDIRRLAEKYEDIGGVLDDKVIQAGENVLLTFTNIKEDAFEPALQAALDLSTRMDQDLNTSVLQLGKALNDPVRGLTALRRVGVQFTDEQETQIKRYVELGDIASAQTIILQEVNREFGGSFAAAGRTSEATIGRFRDSVEGLQQNLATAFIPAIDRVARRLNEIFSDPKTIAAVKDFGERIAGFLTEENLRGAEGAIRDVFGYLASIPWGTIGEGLKIAGQGAKVAIDAFRSLPPGVQNALITLLAANKLTGGLVATGLAQLASVALGQLKTITAGHVTVVGPVTGPPGVSGGRAGGGIGGIALGLTGVGLAAMLADEFEEEIEGFAEDTREALLGKGNALISLPSGPSEWQWPFGAKNPPSWLPEFLGGPAPDLDGTASAVASLNTTLYNLESQTRNVGRVLRDVDLGARLSLPGFSEARNVGDSLSTTIQPLVGAIGRLQTAVEGSRGFGLGALQELISRAQERARVGDGNFVETVRLDPSQVTDLREPTRIAAEQLRLRRAEAFSADVANRTANAFQTAELARTRAATIERLNTLAGKYDIANAQISGANRQLTSLNAKTPPTHPVTVHTTNHISIPISATLLEQRIITARLATSGTPTTPTLR